jgi:hypothetical protein
MDTHDGAPQFSSPPRTSRGGEDRSGSILAVFDSPEQAGVARAWLRHLVDPSRIEEMPLNPGRYQLADINRALEVRTAIRGASAGAALGALLGLLVAAFPGIAPFPALGWAAAGALGGVVSGGLRSLGRIRWDDEGHAVVEVPANRPYTLLIVKRGVPLDQRTPRRIVRALAQNGALAFIEPFMESSRERTRSPAVS